MLTAILSLLFVAFIAFIALVMWIWDTCHILWLRLQIRRQKKILAKLEVKWRREEQSK